jgi:hypothetical protein
MADSSWNTLDLCTFISVFKRLINITDGCHTSNTAQKKNLFYTYTTNYNPVASSSSFFFFFLWGRRYPTYCTAAYLGWLY